MPVPALPQRDPAPIDAALFRELFDLHADHLTAHVLRRCGDPEQAADLVAETFARAWQHRARFEDRGDGAGAWLFGIANNLLLRAWRDGRVERSALQRLHPDAVTDDAAERAVERASAAAQAPQLSAALARLAPEQREAILDRVVEDVPYDEIARRRGGTSEVARSRVSRGLRLLSLHAKVTCVIAMATVALLVAGAYGAGFDWLPFVEPALVSPIALVEDMGIQEADGTPVPVIGMFRGRFGDVPLGGRRRVANLERDAGSYGGSHGWVTHPSRGEYQLQVPLVGAGETASLSDVVLVDGRTGRNLELPDPKTGARWVVIYTAGTVAATGPSYLPVTVRLRHVPAMSRDGRECFRRSYAGSWQLPAGAGARLEQSALAFEALTRCRRHPGVQVAEYEGSPLQDWSGSGLGMRDIGTPADLSPSMSLRVSTGVRGSV